MIPIGTEFYYTRYNEITRTSRCGCIDEKLRIIEFDYKSEYLCEILSSSDKNIFIQTHRRLPIWTVLEAIENQKPHNERTSMKVLFEKEMAEINLNQHPI